MKNEIQEKPIKPVIYVDGPKAENGPEFSMAENSSHFINPFGTLLTDIVEKYSSLEITDPEEKKQVAAVTDAIKTIRKNRADLNKRVKFVNQSLKDFKANVKSEADEIIAGFDELLTRLVDIKDGAKLELENKAAAEEKERIKAYNERANVLLNAGFLSNGIQFVAGSLFISNEDLVIIPIDELQELAEKGKQELERIQNMIDAGKVAAAKAKLLEDEEKEKLQDKPESTPEHFGDDDKGGIYNSDTLDPPARDPGLPLITPVVPVSDLPFDDYNGEDLNKFNIIDTPGHNAGIQLVPEGYNLGYAACLADINHLFGTLPRMTRSDLLKEILKLNPKD